MLFYYTRLGEQFHVCRQKVEVLVFVWVTVCAWLLLFILDAPASACIQNCGAVSGVYIVQWDIFWIDDNYIQAL